MRFRYHLFQKLDQPRLRFLLVLAGSFYKSLRYWRPCRVTYQNGVWVHRHPDGALVEPRISLATISQLDRLTVDSFMFGYVPRHGDIVIDVGAGSGWDTLAFARRVGSTGRVIAIEAHPLMFRCLREMCQLNRLHNVDFIHAAIGPSNHDALISDSVDYQANAVSTDRGLAVPGATLDGIVVKLGLPRIDLLKMNIEGGEAPALAGMLQSIERTRHLVIACHDFLADWGQGAEKRTRARVEAFLHQHRFRLTRRTDSRPWVRDCVYAER